MQSITSVPAMSLGISHRVGYVRPGYDADIVVWNSHPLSLGATPLQVYIDGRPILDEENSRKVLAKVLADDSRTDGSSVTTQRTRKTLDAKSREVICKSLLRKSQKIILTGITTSYIDSPVTNSDNMTMVIDEGNISCFGAGDACAAASSGGFTVRLTNGHILPGLTAVTNNLGIIEIVMGDDAAGDGTVNQKVDIMDPDNVPFAKFGITLEGKAFGRARIAGITRAITAPFRGLPGWFGNGGFLGGVSVGIKTSENRTIFDGIFQDDVALHFAITREARAGGGDITTTSGAVAKLRLILEKNRSKNNIYGKAAAGSIPVVVHAHDKVSQIQYRVLQMHLLKVSDGLQ